MNVRTSLLALGLTAAAAVLPTHAGGEIFYFDREADGAAYLGVTVEEETELPDGGARVTGVTDDSPADEAGIRKGDVIRAIDDEAVFGPAGLTKRIRERDPGDTVRLRLDRAGREMSYEVELRKRPGFRVLTTDRLGKVAEAWPRGVLARSPRFGRPLLGVQLTETTPELREHFGAGPDAGVLVSKVLSGTPAEKAGIRVGDMIVAVDGREIADVEDLVRELGRREGESFPVEVIREGKRRKIEVELPEPADFEGFTGPRA